MSKENDPQPERKIWGRQSYECPNCSHIIHSEYDNTLIVKYFKQPWFDHVRVNCPEDGFTGIYWMDQTDFKDTWLAQFGAYSDDFCDEQKIIDLRGQLFGIEHAIEPRDISKRAEELVNHWGEFLQKIIVDETDFGVWGAA